MYQVLLYYKYISIADPEKVRDDQRKLCEKLNLKGRIIVATEGINGTLEGTVENTAKYIASMNRRKLFKGITYKKSAGTGNAFPKLRVRVRPEIVTTGVPDLDPNQTTGKYLLSEKLYKWFRQKKEFYIVDMRNDYEYASGHFEGFTPSGMSNFFELMEVPERLKHLKNKTIVTVCTGGVRCEKASGFLLNNGFKHVFQLKDGIQTFIEKYPNKYFKGKLYVFDNRITLGFNTDSKDHEVVGTCLHCGNPQDTYVNCEYDLCHLHYICCKDCRDTETGFAFCKPKCKSNWLVKKGRSSLHHTQA
jgi:UPF0176 protein